jgi:hypothetical protein
MLRLGDGEGLIVPHTHLRGASFPRPKMRTGMVKRARHLRGLVSGMTPARVRLAGSNALAFGEP